LKVSLCFITHRVDKHDGTKTTNGVQAHQRQEKKFPAGELLRKRTKERVVEAPRAKQIARMPVVLAEKN
jgi:hypothetical protein